MKHVEKYIIWFLGCIVLYHIVVVWGVFGLWIWDGIHYALVRDILRWIIVLLVLSQVGVKNFKKFWNDRWYECLLVWVLLARAIWYSVYKQVWFSNILIWYKYDIHYLAITLSAVFIGYVALKHKKKDMNEIAESLYWIFACIIIFGAIYQWIKMFFPETFMWLWYWPIGDYAVWANPPLWYRTWPWGLPRLQWLFAWPNNYWYFLAWIFSFLLVRSRYIWRKHTENRLLVAWIRALYIMSLLFTLSRWAFVAVFVQLLILWILAFKKMIKNNTTSLLFWMFWLLMLFWLVVWLSYIKAWSTSLHVEARVTWREAFVTNPMWYGLWTSWPSVHHDGIYLPESQFLQIMLDIGVVWTLLWILCRKVLLGSSVKSLIHEDRIRDLPLFALFWLWIIWLMVEWLFLHVREDSMVNYILLVSFWILLGMSREPWEIM